MRPTVKSAALLLAGFLVGLVTGATAMLRTALPLNKFLIAQELETQSYLRYRAGRVDVAAKSLQAYVDLLQRDAGSLKQLQPNWFGRRLGIAYARLALISERSGDQAARDRFLDLARMQFAIVGSQITREELRDVARVADETWDREMRETAALPQSRPAEPTRDSQD